MTRVATLNEEISELDGKIVQSPERMRVDKEKMKLEIQTLRVTFVAVFWLCLSVFRPRGLYSQPKSSSHQVQAHHRVLACAVSCFLSDEVCSE